MSRSGKTKPNTLVALDILRDEIFSGALAAGSHHLETELAERLGMSRTPVREAALVLEGQGLLEVRPRKGVRILPVSPNDMAEIYDILTELESLAASDAAALGLPDAALAPLERAIDRMDVALEADDRISWAAADDVFHVELVRLGGNSRVISVVGMMADQVRRARLVTLFMRPAPSKSNQDHRRVLQAIRDGNSDEARRIHRAHRQSARDLLIGLLKQHHLKQL